MKNIFHKTFVVILVFTLCNAFANKDEHVSSVVIGSNGESTYAYGNNSNTATQQGVDKKRVVGRQGSFKKGFSKEGTIQEGSLGGVPMGTEE